MTTPHDTDDLALLDRYFAGDCTPSEIEYVRARLVDDRRFLVLHESLSAEMVTRRVGFHADDAAWERMRQVIEPRVRGATTRATESLGGFVRPNNARVGMRWVRESMRGSMRGSVSVWGPRFMAGALALLVLGFVARWSSLRSSGATSVTRYATGRGERSNVTLPDGSRIILAPETRLQYTAEANGARTVTLVGQAYFTVTHDARRPFTVSAGTVQTQVLGTSFDVRRYAQDPFVRIVVVEGKVVSRSRGGRSAPVFLVAKTEGRLTDSTALIVTNGNTDEAEAWTRDHLVFDETPVPDVLQTLQRWYGYEFRLADSSLAKEHVTATFSIGDTASTMARLKALFNVTLQFDGTVITLSPVRRSRTVNPPVYRRLHVFPSQSEVGK